MRSFNLFVPGEYDDAFVYMSRLLAFTSDRRIRVWNLDRVTEDLRTTMPLLGELPSFLFSRNDYLHEPGFRKIMSNPEVQRTILGQLSRFPQPHLEIPATSFDQELGFHITADSLLNVLVYKQRLYAGTEAGLFDMSVDWKRSGEIFVGKPEHRLESRCVHTTARFGAILASCVDDGLWIATEEFSASETRSSFKRIPDRSVRTGWLGDDVANYSTSSHVDVLTNAYTRPTYEQSRQLMEARETRLLTGVGIDKSDVSILYKTLYDRFNVSRGDIQFLYNDDRIFFAHTYAGKLFAAAVSQPIDINQPTFKAPRIKFVKESQGTSETIISASQFKSGVVFETDSEIAALVDQKWTPIVRAGALSVRTFPMSKRFQNLVVSTLANGILITALFPYPHSGSTGELNSIL